MREYILLLSEKEDILLRKGKIYNTKYGKIDLRNVDVGDIIETKKAKFIAVEPTIVDLIKK